MQKKNYSVAFLPEYPLSLMIGGLEIQCKNTKQALLNKNINIKDFSFWDTSIDYDILHIFGNPAYLSDIVHLAKVKNIKVVISSIMGYQGKFRAKYGLNSLIKHIPISTDAKRSTQMFNDADAIIGVTELDQFNLIHNFKINRNKVYIVPNGVNKEFFNSSTKLFKDKYKIQNFCLCVGSICRRKNQINLIHALKKLKLPGVFIGSPVQYEDEYLNRFKKLLLKSNLFLWIPYIEHEDSLLHSAYAASKLVCLPSFAETQSLSALEACAAKKPLILADMPYAKQKPFEDTIKCKPNNINDIAEKIRIVFKNPQNFITNLSEIYTWDNIACEIIKIYSKLI